MPVAATSSKPHYLLSVDTDAVENTGRWRFTLKPADGRAQFQAADIEPGVSGERLDLLTIIRALESLDQPSRVTLTSCSSHIRQGICCSIAEWRANKWQWEFFGYMVPIKHADLWQRIDHLLSVHTVECRRWRFDAPHSSLSGPKKKPSLKSSTWGLRVASDIWLKCVAPLVPYSLRRGMTTVLQRLKHGLMRLRPLSKPCVGGG